MTFIRNMNRRAVLRTGGAMALGTLAAPTILRAQEGPIVLGHLTPRTGFLGPLGDYAVMGVDLAVEHINAEGGIMGRDLQVLKEDSVNPQTASTKAERMIERDGVAAITGEISSASTLAIGQVAERTGTVFVNTGGNSDTLRGSDCKRHMFHVETQNAMYLNGEGLHFLNADLVEGKKWYLPTADYAFGHDLLNGARAFLDRNGGEIVGDDLVATDATDFSAIMLKIRSAQPDVVALNLAGTQITGFLKQYGEFGLDYPIGGFGFDTQSAWAAGPQNFSGTWPSVWNHLIDTEESQAFAKAFADKYGKPPENQAWSDYTALRIMAKAMTEIGGTDADALIEYLESGATFDLMKSRPGYFNPDSHQLLQDIYAITALPEAEVENEWDIFTTSGPVLGADQPLEVLIEDAVGGTCTFAA
ncbi:ABC transporter substrate-binding protein [Jannaschia rubra]|uniref:Leucine-, isoleucine-, valine-, threonine-, and alanine-binding protein n=1 Tax=Jannaschia rubra TaxID=282197 RepID=A0A0M6XWC0_9RHOB|nr:ABC transporter substrate-binding protein [Jannaschia rubra]CTQ34593.1 Leucine-, isoleucine-, valine-, threonine-, and alanine-binding protein precursor [Jannaschia rubra]SFG72386.1 amino acid/amide ABC transporter substrate-binding protein, HAAT family [Jannaschia rubra]